MEDRAVDASAAVAVSMDDLERHKENLRPRAAGYKVAAVLAGAGTVSGTPRDTVGSTPQSTTHSTPAPTYALPVELRGDPRRSKFASDLEFHRYILERAIRHVDDQAAETDDPVEPFHRYARFLEENYPSGHPNFMKVIEKCVRRFKPNRRFANDKRLLWMWLNIAARAQEPIDVFKYCSVNELFTELPRFYEQYAALLLANRHYDDAVAVLELAIQRNVQPIQRLKSKLADLLKKRAIMESEDQRRSSEQCAAAARDAREADLERARLERENASAAIAAAAAASSVKRAPLATNNGSVILDTVGGSEKGGIHVSGAPSLTQHILRPDIQHAIARNGGKLDVFVEEDGGKDGGEILFPTEETAGKWNDFGSSLNSKKENMRDATKWTGQTLRQSSTTAPFAPSNTGRTGRTSVFEDLSEYNEVQDNAKPSEISVFRDDDASTEGPAPSVPQSSVTVLREKTVAPPKKSSVFKDDTRTTSKRRLEDDSKDASQLGVDIGVASKISKDNNMKLSESGASTATHSREVTTRGQPAVRGQASYVSRLKKEERMMCDLESVYQLVNVKDPKSGEIKLVEIEFSFEELLSMTPKYAYPPLSNDSVQDSSLAEASVELDRQGDGATDAEPVTLASKTNNDDTVLVEKKHSSLSPTDFGASKENISIHDTLKHIPTPDAVSRVENEKIATGSTHEQPTNIHSTQSIELVEASKSILKPVENVEQSASNETVQSPLGRSKLVIENGLDKQSAPSEFMNGSINVDDERHITPPSERLAMPPQDSTDDEQDGDVSFSHRKPQLMPRQQQQQGASPTINTKAAMLDVFEMFRKPIRVAAGPSTDNVGNGRQEPVEKGVIEVEEDETISAKVFRRNLAGNVFDYGSIFVDEDTQGKGDFL